MAKSPFDDTVPLDGMVGSLDHLAGRAPFARPQDVPIAVRVFGDGVSALAASGLAEDLGALVRQSTRPPAPGERARERPPARPAAGDDADIGIALHGLQLDPDAAVALRRRMRALVRERLSPQEADK